jgi:hypothetical protein
VVRARLGGAIPEMIEAIARGVPDDASRARPVYQQRLADAVTGAIVAYLDELAAACAQGYAEARAQAAGDRQRQLLGTILSEPPPGAELLASLARTVGWALPARVAVVVLGGWQQDGLLLPPGVLADWTGLAGTSVKRRGLAARPALAQANRQTKGRSALGSATAVADRG